MNKTKRISIVHHSRASKTYSSLAKTSRTIQVGKELCPIYNSPKGAVAITGLSGYPSSSFIKLIK